MERLTARWLGFGGAALLAGCTLVTSFDGLSSGEDASDSGGASDEGADSGNAPIDASSESAIEDAPPVIVDGCSQANCFDMPQGFSLVAYGAKGATCPSTFGSGGDTVENVTLANNACSCNCNVTAQPSCQNGAIQNFFGGAGAGTCPTAGGTYANNGCGTDGFLGPFGVGNEHRETQPGPSGGTCAASEAKNNAAITVGKDARVCQATTIAQCNGKTCPPTVAPFKVCIASEGNATCPAAFSEKHLLGSSASFTCSNNCSCTIAATCPGGTLNYYASADCSGAVGFSFAVNNTCVATVSNGTTFGSYKYVASAPTNVSCNKGGSSSPSAVTLNQQRTVCCTP